MTFVKNKTEILEPPYPKDEMGIFFVLCRNFFSLFWFITIIDLSNLYERNETELNKDSKYIIDDNIAGKIIICEFFIICFLKVLC